MLSSIQALLFLGMLVAAILVCIPSLNTYILLCLDRRKRILRVRKDLQNWPVVTVQIPTYNEKNVIKRTLESCLELDYPEDRVEIVIVDDSTDETVDILKDYEDRYRPRIKVTHRISRAGYKAGALNTAMKYSQGEFFLIVDADTSPNKSFLKEAMPYFIEDENLGFIQGRIEYINAESSWLTRSLALANEWYGAFTQAALSEGEMFLGFLGHGGVFRRTAIEDAGGWESDTITEDMDLSYRVQMRGWRSLFLEKARCVEEVPSSYNAAIQQYNRHIKGPIQNLRKHGGKILKAKGMTALKKFEALIQMAYPLSYFLGLLCVVLTCLTYLLLPGNFLTNFWLSPLGIIFSLFILIAFPYVSLVTSFYLPWLLIVLSLPFLYLLTVKRGKINAAKYIESLLGATLIWNDNMLTGTKALIELFIGRETVWIPTPKLGGDLRLTTEKSGGKRKGIKVQEAALRMISAALMILCFTIIMHKNFIISAFGLLLPVSGWIISSYLILRSP